MSILNSSAGSVGSVPTVENNGNTVSAAVVAQWMIVTWLLFSTGCTTVPNMWPFIAQDNTTFKTPAIRRDAILALAGEATGLDDERQRELTDQLARQIQVEPDPLVRQAIIESISRFQTPLAEQVLQAGLQDRDLKVQIACCEALGARGSANSVAALESTLRGEKEMSVRVAAAKALGGIKSPESVRALAVALEDRSPALQYVAVRSMKSVSGQDLGGDVDAWRRYAANGELEIGDSERISVAERLREYSPF